jgi:HEXXH motif-containing protein
VTEWEKICRGFSCPQECLDEDFCVRVAVEYAREYTGRFLARFEPQLRLEADGLREYLAAWLRRSTSLDEVWDVAFGRLPATLKNPESSSIIPTAVALGLRLHERGGSCEWAAKWDRPVQFRFGSLLLPPTTSIAVRAKPGRIRIRTTRNGQSTSHSCVKTSRGWKCLSDSPLPTVRCHACQFVFITPGAALAFDADSGEVMKAKHWPPVLRAYEQALDVIAGHSPAYLPWVARVVKVIQPITSTASTIRSGSAFHLPGVLQISLSKAPALAEMLVHEASHQHVHLITRIGSIDDGTDKRLYYSPIRRMGRPIQYILLAYHAFSNVLLFYRECQSRGLADDGYCRDNERDLMPQLAELEQALQSTRALTPLGRALWEPLAARIH